MLFFFKQKTAYELRISDRSSDVCSSDLAAALHLDHHRIAAAVAELLLHLASLDRPLEAERLAGQSRLVLFVTHRKPNILLRVRSSGVRRLRLITRRAGKTGRATCRERVCQYV